MEKRQNEKSLLSELLSSFYQKISLIISNLLKFLTAQPNFGL